MADDNEAWRGEPDPEQEPRLVPLAAFFGGRGRPATPEEIEAEKKWQADRLAAAQIKAVFVQPLNRDAICPKCRSSKPATMQFCTGGVRAGCFDYTAGEENIHRTCQECGYIWFEWPLDRGEVARPPVHKEE